jgi:hypothetical protein
MISQRVRIQSAILQVVLHGEALAIAIGYEDGLPVALEGVRPSSALCNEVSKSWSRDSRAGTDLVSNSSSWTFELHLKYDQEVSTEPLEYELREGIGLAADEANGLPAAFVELSGEASYKHPRQQQSGGSRVVLTFEVTEVM